ncbi:hypothetical protein [Streptomyces sp. NPDC056405]|uniref:hypothetical protein n=1 Tax=Streptomyces sp. NPDC056405 TaxID=3345811 RepID=UPI0035DA7E3D
MEQRKEPHRTHHSRRFVLKGAAGTVLALGTVSAPGASVAAAAPGGLPDYQYLKTLLTADELEYNPTGEIIFPCIRGTVGRLSDPLGRYYLYYAPHDAPGGICLAYSDSIEGPYTEYADNPLVSRSWAPHYNVGHVSSPHVMWHEGAQEMWLYFHGDNDTTRLARSTNGIDFRYDKVVLNTSMLPKGTTETTYARVFPHRLPDRSAEFVMLFMVNTTANHRNIGWGWSADGRNWQFAQQPLIRHSDVGSVDIGNPHLLTTADNAYVVYNQDKASGGNILVTEVGKDFSRRRHLGIFYDSMSAAPDRGRAGSMSFGTENGVPYMVYEAGDRLQGAIALARAR